MVCALLAAGARADLRDTNGCTPLDLLPRALRAEVERLVQQAKEERGRSTRPDDGRMGAPSATAAVLPPPRYQPASQLQAASKDGGEGSSESPGVPPAEASSIISGRATPEHVCSMCGAPPSASSGGVAKLKACGRCLSMRYCSQECQKKHWGACSQLREKRERMKGVKSGQLERLT